MIKRKKCRGAGAPGCWAGRREPGEGDGARPPPGAAEPGGSPSPVRGPGAGTRGGEGAAAGWTSQGAGPWPLPASAPRARAGCRPPRTFYARTPGDRAGPRPTGEPDAWAPGGEGAEAAKTTREDRGRSGLGTRRRGWKGGGGREGVLHKYLIILLLLINRHNNGPRLRSLGIRTWQGHGSLQVPSNLRCSLGIPHSAGLGAASLHGAASAAGPGKPDAGRKPSPAGERSSCRDFSLLCSFGVLVSKVEGWSSIVPGHLSLHWPW